MWNRTSGLVRLDRITLSYTVPPDGDGAPDPSEGSAMRFGATIIKSDSGTISSPVTISDPGMISDSGGMTSESGGAR